MTPTTFVIHYLFNKTICSLNTSDVTHIELIKGDGEVCLERSSIYRVHVVRRTLVNTGVHLCRWVNFNFRFNPVVAYWPLVDLHKLI